MSSRWRAYPRSRGEHRCRYRRIISPAGLPPLTRGAPPPTPSATTPDSGLPPLTRGALSGDGCGDGLCGPTPAHAGSTLCAVCMSICGLPPLARGARVDFEAESDGAGPTPACAGSTSSASSGRTSPTAYPRLRGEHVRKLTESGGCDWPTPACAGSTRAIRGCARASWAYPRLRGEHRLDAVRGAGVPGLPPLARGARRGGAAARRLGGPTPACAGSTSGVVSVASAISAYPRLRGEHEREIVSKNGEPGLPPLARGAPLVPRGRSSAARPTPACAGSTSSGSVAGTAIWAYPRLRGEHWSSSCARSPPRGLPPLARGAHQRLCARLASPGPTPACAGSTGVGAVSHVGGPAYPRLRGEHTCASPGACDPSGLPPLARGALDGARLEREMRGPTPACAGSTWRPAGGARRARAYPRLRGEHTSTPHSPGPPGGLPPLARGARARTATTPPGTGPTPACAGSTFRRRPSSIPPEAYPRLRGEHLSASHPPVFRAGLPPLARGAHGALDGVRRLRRPTPACAGSTTTQQKSQQKSKAYPRLRGEHSQRPRRQCRRAGLPPLARGAPRDPYFRHPDLRPTPACAGSTTKTSCTVNGSKGLPPLARGAPRGGRNPSVFRGPTPACAGSTSSPSPSRWRSWAYPRLRGEHPASAAAQVSCTGLPPLARGAPRLKLASSHAGRPTPACAGSTVVARSYTRLVKAYPRLRGEHVERAGGRNPSAGLPPLARGAPDASERRLVPARPTPACAGSTPARWTRSIFRWAYPRLRGEHGGVLRGRVLMRGLPPLARGALECCFSFLSFIWPTPACAGSTPLPILGLPPLARGAPCGDLGRLPVGGPTPACAGSTLR